MLSLNLHKMLVCAFLFLEGIYYCCINLSWLLVCSGSLGGHPLLLQSWVPPPGPRGRPSLIDDNWGTIRTIRVSRAGTGHQASLCCDLDHVTALQWAAHRWWRYCHVVLIVRLFTFITLSGLMPSTPPLDCTSPMDTSCRKIHDMRHMMMMMCVDMRDS